MKKRTVFIKKDITGKRFGQWTVIEEQGVIQAGKYKLRCCLCRCKCGTVKSVRKYQLMKGRTKRCSDCAMYTHRGTYHPLYITWDGMKQRCYNPKNTVYKDYGGRGIKICKRWSGVNGFKNFLADMGEKPTPKHSIDRINNNANYSPSNCRWATAKEQRQNQRIYKKVM